MFLFSAGRILSEIWSDTFVDDCPTVAEYVVSSEDGSEDDSADLISKDDEWRFKHVRESKYLLQISKCDDKNCCSARRSSLFHILKEGFLPPPIPIKQTRNGLSYMDHPSTSGYHSLGKGLSSDGQYLSLFQNISMGAKMLPELAHQKFPHEIPFDFSCPSVKTRLSSQTCELCCRYFGSLASMSAHFASAHHDCEDAANEVPFMTKVQPNRILACRGAEFLCVVKTSMNTNEVNWLTQEEINVDVDINMEEVPDVQIKSGIKVYTEAERYSLWVDDL